MTIIYESHFSCPGCKTLLRWTELTSAYISSSVIYSDGKQDTSPSLSFRDEILICPECNTNFWKDDARVEEDEDIPYTEDLPEAKTYSNLNVNSNPDYPVVCAKSFENMIAQGFADTIQKEVYLRMQIWHLLNDMVRYSNKRIKGYLTNLTGQKGKLSKNPINRKERRLLFKSNLSKLISIFHPEYDEDRLLLAEMHRELGQFEEAKRIIDNINNKELESAVNAILKKINSKRKRVFEIET